jgi:hypothetical protein
MRSCSRVTATCLAAVTAAGCATQVSGGPAAPSAAATAMAVDLAQTRPLGAGPAFRLGALGNRAVVDGAAVGALRCGAVSSGAYGAHVELFARDRGVAVPAGIGIAPPQRRQGATVTGGRCTYPVRTSDPTGVVEVTRRRGSGAPTVGQLFQIWGQPLSTRRLAGFRAVGRPGVVAFVDGRRWRGDPRGIPLRRHAQIVLELGALVAPHPAYLFPPGL